MTPRELLDHERAWYGKLATLRLLGSKQWKLGPKRLTVIIYRAKRDEEVKGYVLKPQYRLAASYGQQILVSTIIEKPSRKRKR